jgi:anti-anti-sigma regulatory factor
MEAATQSQPPQQAPGGAGAPPAKIAIEKFADGPIVCLRLSGTIDESFEGKKLAATIKAKTLVLDLADIKKISSFGIREWVDFVKNVGDHVDEIVLIECAPKVVDQLNMVGNFSGKGRVFSFYAPFRCDYCDNDARVLFHVDRDWEVIKSMKPAERACDKCGEPQYFDEDPTTYFSYIVGQQPFELDPDVAAFLSSKLNYAVSDASRKLRIDKIIEGRSTYLKLAGDLDGSFPREKLAEGLEGTVIIEVAGVGKIEPAGAAEWRGFLQMVTPSADSIYLLGVPPVFLEKLTRPEDLGPKGQVITFAIPYTCNTCSTTSLQPVDVEQHYDVLKFATPPETRCGDCKNPMVCAASEALLSHLTTLPKPTITADTKKFIKEVRDRKPEKKKVATTVAEVAAQTRGGSFSVALLAALVVAVVLVGGFFAWRQMQSSKAKAAGLGKMTAKGAEERPAWLTGDTANSSYCNDTDGGGMSCVGVSPASPTQEDAAIDAQNAALEAIANGLVVRMHDSNWDRMSGVWSQTRQARMAEYEKDPTSASTRRAVKDGRQQVAKLLLATAGASVPAAPTGKYWEEYDNGAKQYLAFAQYQLSPSEVKGLIEKYNHTEAALGATVATVYPMVAWRYPEVEKGAVIMALADGPLRKMGLAAEFVVLGVGNDENALRTVASAADFVEAAATAYGKIEKPGGKMFVSVERGADEPKVYDLSVDAPKPVQVESSGSGKSGSGKSGSGKSGTGSVNVWDRYGGSGGGSKDDPTQ